MAIPKHYGVALLQRAREAGDAQAAWELARLWAQGGVGGLARNTTNAALMLDEAAHLDPFASLVVDVSRAALQLLEAWLAFSSPFTS